MLGKISADDILKYFLIFSQKKKALIFSYFFPRKKGFDISCKLSPKETICLKCQSLFSGKYNKIIINLSFY